MHFVVVVAVVAIVGACGTTPHVNNNETMQRFANSSYRYRGDWDWGRGNLRISRCNFGVGHLRLACVYRLHLSRSISTPHSCDGGVL